jgi:hypothetical protein
MSIKSILISSLVVLFSISAYGQSWEEKMFEGDANFYEVQSLANAYFSQRDTLEKGKGWKPYKRWEWFTEQRVYPSGDLGMMEKAMGSYVAEFIENYDTRSSDDQANWTFMGPSVVPDNAGGQEDLILCDLIPRILPSFGRVRLVAVYGNLLIMGRHGLIGIPTTCR